ncbi:hypothetical protein Glove_155g42 [Diversispora epigaea]|uniref:Uncharacterized protein n=1 Tax=Diversispora epigaea TaxID=1348612 RepID=A0A397IWY6_9GLOM|nr:hypothetical protein Glove_155g42 [Diversispora epigaea]
MVKPFDFEIVTISPMDILLINEAGGLETTTVAKVGIACFGLIDKYKAIGDDNLPKFVSNGFEDYFDNFPECNKGIEFHKVDLIGYGECGFYLNVINGMGRRNEIYESNLCENENVIKDELLEYKRRKSEFWEGKDILRAEKLSIERQELIFNYIR